MQGNINVYILEWSLTFAASVYVNKIVYIITRKLYWSIQENNTSVESSFHHMPEGLQYYYLLIVLIKTFSY